MNPSNRDKTHCKRGHPFDEANTLVAQRACAECVCAEGEWEMMREEEGTMRRAKLVGRVCDPRPSVGQWRTIYYAFEAQSALSCDGCHGPIAPGELFSRPEINQRTQRFSRVYYCRRCVPFSEVGA